MDARTRPGWSATLGAVLTSRWALPVLVVAAFALSLVVQHLVYPGLSWNRDEPVYLWHVDVLRAGHLATTDGGHPTLFQPWLSASRGGDLFSQYTLGWPLVLLLGAVLGSAALGVAAGASLAVAGTWAFVRELVQDRAVATVAATFMLASPILAVQGGVHLNYLFTLGLGLLCVTATFSGVRRRHRPRLVVAGLLLGWIFLTRPYDAVVWGLLASVPLLVEHRRSLRSLLGPAGWAALGALPIVVATLLVNRRLTGSPTEFPITVADPLDQFGFGTRRLMPGFDLIAYGPSVAATSTGRNSFWLPFFLFGAHGGLATAAAGAWVTRRSRATHVLVGLGAAFPVAYFAFFGTEISSLTARLSGPIYYIPAYAALCALMAVAVVRLGRCRAAMAAGLVTALVVITVPLSVSRLGVNHRLSQANLPWARSVEQVPGRALVVPSPRGYLLFVNPFSDNGADLDGRILYASDSGPELLDLVEAHPDRTPYLQRANLSVVDLLPSEHPRTPTVSLTPMQALRGNVHLMGTVGAPGGPVSARWIEVDGKRVGDTLPVSGEEPIDIDVLALGLSPGLHSLDVIGGRTSGASTPAPMVRRAFYVRVGSDEVTLLAPGTASRMVRRPGAKEARWEDALDVPELRLTPRLRAAG